MVVLDVVVRQLEELGQQQEGQLQEEHLQEDQVQIQGLDHLLQTVKEHQIE